MRKSKYIVALPVKDKYLLINGLSGAVRLVSQESAQKFFRGEITPELTPFFTHLTPEEEREKARSLCQFLMKKAAQCVDGSMVVTYDCNLRCPYCYERWVKHPAAMRVVITPPKVDRAYDALELLNKECRKKSLNITGGEPLMKKNEDIILSIVKKGDDLGYTFSFFTNGVELHHFIPLLSSLRVESLMVTIDGPPSIHNKRRVFRRSEDTFSTIVKNVEEARAAGLPLLIRTNTDLEILSRIDELARIFRERGWADDPRMRFSLAYMCDQNITSRTSEEAIELHKKIMEVSRNPELRFLEAHPFIKLSSILDEKGTFWPAFWNCNSVSKRYVFDPFGNIYSCRGLLGLTEERIGVYVPSLAFNENYEKWKKRTLFALETCEECEIALLCGGGCGYASILLEKDILRPLCTVTKEVIAKYVEYLYEMKYG